MVTLELWSWVMGFQLCCELYPIFSMRSSHHKSNYTICTARSSLFHLYQLQPSATSGPDWQRSHFQVTGRMVKIYYTLKPIIFQWASRFCIRNVIYIYSRGEPYIKALSSTSHVHSLILVNPERQIDNMLHLIISSSTHIGITACDSKVGGKFFRTIANGAGTELWELGQNGDRINLKARKH